MKIPENMNCVIIDGYGNAEKLKYTKASTPKINPNEVLIKVNASGVNRPDILQRQGKYKPPNGASLLPGLEVSGQIVKIGKNATSFKMHDKVCALTHGGGYAEFCKVHKSHVLPIPKGLNYKEAAAIPETFFTVWYNMLHIGKLKEKETVLIHGGSSGIGTIAIQMAKLKKCKVIITAGSSRKIKKCINIGADYAINYKNEDFEKKIYNYTNGNGCDLILDMTGKENFRKNLKSLRDKGRLIIIAFLTGNKSTIELQQIIIKRLTITGSTLRPRTISEKAQIAKNIKSIYWPLLESKKIKPLIFKTFPLKKAVQAHKLMESSKHIGKIILINE